MIDFSIKRDGSLKVCKEKYSNGTLYFIPPIKIGPKRLSIFLVYHLPFQFESGLGDQSSGEVGLCKSVPFFTLESSVSRATGSLCRSVFGLTVSEIPQELE